MAAACKENGCALLGGETAEMPGVYTQHAFDVAGTVVGMVKKGRILPRKEKMQAGDVLLGFRSNSPHTNGYSLIRRLCKDEDLLNERPELGGGLADLLLKPHRSYLNLVQPILDEVKGLAHITGGGFFENIPRVLPETLQAVVELDAWPVPPLYQWLQAKGQISQKEMYRVFNMGIGFIAVVDADKVETVREKIAEETFVIGCLSDQEDERVVLR